MLSAIEAPRANSGREVLAEGQRKLPQPGPDSGAELSCWCSGLASDSWSKGRSFDSRPGRYQVNYFNSAFHPSGVGKSLHGCGLAGRIHLCRVAGNTV